MLIWGPSHGDSILRIQKKHLNVYNDNDDGFQNTKPNSMNPNNQNVGNVAANQDEARERYNAML